MTDEYVGVVHAVVHRLAPGVPVVDLTHGVPPFEVAAGARVLERSVPHLGAGVVLAVVDPGVGSARRGVALEVPPSAGPRFLVGPDNGVLVPAAELLGGARAAVSLSGRSTFDGRDVFAPAAAHLARGGAPGDLGAPLDVASLVAGPDPDPRAAAAGPGWLTAAVTWVDRFGNVELSGDEEHWALLAVTVGTVVVVERVDRSDPVGGQPPVRARRVASFSALASGEVGLIIDSAGRRAVVVDRGSAAATLGISGPGAVLRVRSDGG